MSLYDNLYYITCDYFHHNGWKLCEGLNLHMFYWSVFDFNFTLLFLLLGLNQMLLLYLIIISWWGAGYGEGLLFQQTVKKKPDIFICHSSIDRDPLKSHMETIYWHFTLF